MKKLKVLDLFSGIGGFSLGLERTGGFETVAFCEIDPFCQKVLKKHWPDVPIYNDVRTLNYDGAVDVITGGFPCQPFSTAGKRGGGDDSRYLWPAMFSLIEKHRPSWVIGENVAGLINMGFQDREPEMEDKTVRREADQDSFNVLHTQQERMFLDFICEGLEGIGYQVQPLVIPACAVNAPHRRDRVWIVCHAEHNGQTASEKRKGIEAGNGSEQARSDEACKSARPVEQYAELDAHTQRDRLQGFMRQDSVCEARTPQALLTCSNEQWADKYISTPLICGVDDGVPDRTHRLKSLGNSVVPQIPEIIGHAILASQES